MVDGLKIEVPPAKAPIVENFGQIQQAERQPYKLSPAVRASFIQRLNTEPQARERYLAISAAKVAAPTTPEEMQKWVEGAADALEQAHQNIGEGKTSLNAINMLLISMGKDILIEVPTKTLLGPSTRLVPRTTYLRMQHHFEREMSDDTDDNVK